MEFCDFFLINLCPRLKLLYLNKCIMMLKYQMNTMGLKQKTKFIFNYFAFFSFFLSTDMKNYKTQCTLN